MRRWTHFMALSAILMLSLAASRVGAETAGASADRRTPPVLSGCEPDYPPFCMVTPEGQADGFSVELLRAALKAVGREATFKTGVWSEIKADLAEGRLEVLPLVGRTPEREATYDFTFPYLTMHGTIVVRDTNADIQGPADLRGKQVAVLGGDNAEEYLHRADLGAAIVPLPSFETALRGLSSGKYDAVVIQKLLAFQLMRQAGITNLRVVSPPLKEFTQNFCFAVRNGNGALLAQLNEGLAIAMADGTSRRLHAKWFSALEAMGYSKSRIVVGGDDDYPPYEFLDENGQPAGLNVELTKAIARQMGLAVDIRLGPWVKIRRGLETGGVDMAQGMFYSVDRDKQFTFSSPYTLVQHAIAVRKGSAVPSSMGDLAGKSILVMAGDIMNDLAVENGYEKALIPVASQEEALRLLAAGKGDCALVAKVPALYWIKKNGWRNLELSASPVLSAEYCYAVPHGSETLLSGFSEGLAALKTTREYRDIQSKWLSPYEPFERRLLTLAKYGLAMIVLLIVLLAGSFLWSRTLQRRVVVRTRELTEEITERKRAEEVRREVEGRYRLLFEQSPNGIVVIDPKTARFLEFNETAHRQLGYSRDEFARLSISDVEVEETSEDTRARIAKVSEQGRDDFETRQRTRQGDIRDIHVTAQLSQIMGDTVYHCVWRDITERKRAEAEILRLNAELAMLLRAKTVQLAATEDELEGFAHSVSHDLRTPIRRIDEWSNALQEDYGETLDGTGQQYLNTVRAEIQTMGEHVDAMLDISRVAGRELLIDSVDLGAMAESQRAALLKRQESRDVQFVIPENLIVQGDAGLLRTLLKSLLENAWKATRRIEKGALIELGTTEKGGVPVHFVRDNGMGFDMAYAQKLFRPFQKLHGVEEFPGMGVGLAVVLRIVRRHGGKVWAEGEVGKGATFYFTLGAGNSEK